MFPKLVITLCALTLIGLAVLALRQERLSAMHEMTVMHTQMDRVRRDTWDLQVRIAESARPQDVEQAIERQGVTTEPIPMTDPLASPYAEQVAQIPEADSSPNRLP